MRVFANNYITYTNNDGEIVPLNNNIVKITFDTNGYKLLSDDDSVVYYDSTLH